jgi:hypothetical protein
LASAAAAEEDEVSTTIAAAIKSTAATTATTATSAATGTSFRTGSVCVLSATESTTRDGLYDATPRTAGAAAAGSERDVIRKRALAERRKNMIDKTYTSNAIVFLANLQNEQD